MRIGLTNDDGIHAEGLLSIARELIIRGHSIRISAPAINQSATAHSLTVYRPLKIEKIQLAGELFREVVSFCVHGTPADSARVFSTEISKDWRPDIVVSGINSGLNVGLPCVSSGTVSAAREATFAGIPAIAFSTGFSSSKCKYEEVAHLAADLIDTGIVQQLPPFSILNVNLPSSGKTGFKGYRLTKQGNAHFQEEYKIKKNIDEKLAKTADTQKHPEENPVTRTWWLSLEGDLVNGHDESLDTDFGALKAGYGSITPMGPFFQTLEHNEFTLSVQKLFKDLLTTTI